MRRPSRQGMLSLCLRFAQGLDSIATSLTGRLHRLLKVPSLISLLLPFSCLAQNIKYEWVNIQLYITPLRPLAVDEKTFSVSIVDLGNQLYAQDLENIQQRIDLPGFSRVTELR